MDRHVHELRTRRNFQDSFIVLFHDARLRVGITLSAPYAEVTRSALPFHSPANEVLPALKTLLRMLACLLLLIALAAAAFVAWARHAGGFSARATPSRIETLLAHSARSMAMPAAAKALQNPVADTPEVQHEAMAHYADHCATCHANDGSGDTMYGKGLYPKPPDLRAAATQNLTDGELFYYIQNGVRLTGMPAFGSPNDDGTDSWKLVRFIRHLPTITPSQVQQMNGMNPKSPDEVQEEKEEQDFLNGSTTK